MKRSIISLCVFALFAVNVMCNAVEEKRNQNMSQMSITAKEIRINTNEIATNGNLK